MKTKVSGLLSLLIAAVMAFSFSACALGESGTTQDTGTVTVLDANNQEVEVRVNPKRVAILEPSALDILDAAGMENTGIERLGVQKTDSYLPDYLSKYMGDEYVNVSSLFEVDYDMLDLLDPEADYLRKSVRRVGRK